jgi:Cu+-exporting ATPase
MNTIRLSLSGMHCAGCVARVEKALDVVGGVESATVNLAERTATVQGNVSVDALISAIEAAGYEAAELRNVEDEEEKDAAEIVHYRRLMRRATVAAVVGMPLFVFGMAGMLPELSHGTGRLFWFIVGLLTLGVLVYSGGHFFTGAWKSARNHNANMDTLIALGTGTAWVFSMAIVAWPDWVPVSAQHAYFVR